MFHSLAPVLPLLVQDESLAFQIIPRGGGSRGGGKIPALVERTHAPVLPSRRSAPTEAARQESGGLDSDSSSTQLSEPRGSPVKRRHLVALVLNCTVLLFSPVDVEHVDV